MAAASTASTAVPEARLCFQPVVDHVLRTPSAFADIEESLTKLTLHLREVIACESMPHRNDYYCNAPALCLIQLHFRQVPRRL